MIARSLLAAALALPLLLIGCRKATVENYRIPKEKDAEMPLASSGMSTDAAPSATPGMNAPGMGSGMAGTPVATADGAGLTWTAPADWKPKAGSAMRKASFSVPGPDGTEGDLAITAFPGDVGGELANMNRWRGQLQLPPISEAELAPLLERVEYNGLKFVLFDIRGQGEKPNRILGASIPLGDATWFVKLTATDAAVTAAKPAFLAFLQTIKRPAAPTP
ncbi:hypothetical protein [Opitutus sp. ER46]|uniref:hypothetical protein n=1 Tax=Opitutus sp. ER46 TaxID=2161864 RepID=UPI000D310D2D|nr:hypothetical protein [Opitutus sp. ER46]PTX94522.1 hypothetical protein DB354_12340 [Opitutus sp. ER46]